MERYPDGQREPGTARDRREFALDDTSTIDLGTGGSLNLTDAGFGLWDSGEILGSGAGANVNVSGTILRITGTAEILGADLNISQSAATKVGGAVDLINMMNNLTLSGTNNRIDVKNGGLLNLAQTISAPGLQDTEGGLAYAPAMRRASTPCS